MKKCNHCKKEKDISEFHKNKHRIDGYSHYCKECVNKVDRKNYQKNKVKIKRRHKERYSENPQKYIKMAREINLKHRFGLSLNDYERMLKEQNNLCAICGKTELSYNRKLAVDHDHKTGKVRALLCMKCNHVLGNANDDINVLKNAILYLEKHK